MFTKLLIANRGEIAQRILFTAHRLGVKTVAVVSEADRGAPYARLAGEVVEIGAGPATESYLRGDRIVAAAKATGAEAIHPGYGFLAENADFADAVRKAGLIFIGPSPEAMRRMGGKAEAKAIAAAAGVPVVPGYGGDKQDAKTPRQGGQAASAIPCMIKAVAGGGGRGMRLVEREEDFAAALESARREAEARVRRRPGAAGETDRRPAPHRGAGVRRQPRQRGASLRARLLAAAAQPEGDRGGAGPRHAAGAARAMMRGGAVACAKAVDYEGAGTVEFLVEGGRSRPTRPGTSSR